jgi:hypothetical protein
MMNSQPGPVAKLRATRDREQRGMCGGVDVQPWLLAG